MTNRVSVVYSDSDPAFTLDMQCQLLRRPNELFWGDKFKACLDACDSDLMLVIQADCHCDNWPELVQKYMTAPDRIPAIGVWAPLIDWTPWNLARTHIASIDSTSLCIVAQTDGIVFGISSPVRRRMATLDYRDNLYGWGIDTLAVANAYANGLLAVVDRSVFVKHPRLRGYPKADALQQYRDFLRQLTAGELVQYRLAISQIKINDLNIQKMENPNTP